MNWFYDLIKEPSTIQTIILVSLVAGVGLRLGKVKIFGVSLGVTFVFFMGILLGHFHHSTNKELLSFVQSFGLVLFIYTLGLQVGPGLFPSLKKGGVKLNALSLLVIGLGIASVLVFSIVSDVSLPNLVGLLCGAVTNTPALGAAQETIMSMPNIADPNIASQMALATAVSYPMGVVGVIMVLIFMRKLWLPKTEQKGVRSKTDNETYAGEFLVTNPAIMGKNIKNLMKLAPHKFVISRIHKEDDETLIATSDTVLEEGDRMIVITTKGYVSAIREFLGEEMDVDWNKADIDWDRIDNSQLVSRNISVTKSDINGEKLGSLRLRNRFNVNITRIERVGIRLLASPNLSLQIGDSLTIVGEKKAIDEVAKILGNEMKELRNPNLIAIFVGIALGLILGSFPIYLPGLSMPIRLGIAGGPIVVGILMSAFGPRFHITTYTTQSSNLFMRQFGLSLYLACLGILSGEHFFDTVMNKEGLIWISIGAAMTIIPILVTGLIAIKVYKTDFAESA